MELWLEYLVRHGLTEYTVEKKQRIVVHDPCLNDSQTWLFFLMTYGPFIRNLNPQLNETTIGWNAGINFRNPTPLSPSAAEQMEIVFTALPYLEISWREWSTRTFT